MDEYLSTVILIELLKHGSPSGEAATVNKNWFALRPDMCTTLCTVYRHDTYIYTCVSIFMCLYVYIYTYLSVDIHIDIHIYIYIDMYIYR